jgi:hypothetical protein
VEGEYDGYGDDGHVDGEAEVGEEGYVGKGGGWLVVGWRVWKWVEEGGTGKGNEKGGWVTSLVGGVVAAVALFVVVEEGAEDRREAEDVLEEAAAGAVMVRYQGLVRVVAETIIKGRRAYSLMSDTSTGRVSAESWGQQLHLVRLSSSSSTGPLGVSILRSIT